MIPDRLSQALPKLAESIPVSGPWTIEPLQGDASNRTYFRWRAGEKTFIVMVLAEGFNSLAEQVTRTTRKAAELPYIDVGRYLQQKSVHVPALLGYDAERGILVIEDFGDVLLVDVVNQGDPKRIVALYENALDQLEKLSVIAPDDPKTSIAFARKFDRDLYNWEFMHFVEYALDQRLKEPPSPSERTKIIAELSKLTEKYLSWTKVITHRDFHSRNLSVLSENQLGVLDFQDALLGPLYYDLASLLRDSYARLEPELQDELLDRYRNQIRQHRFKGSSSRDEFRKSFDLMGLHRNLKAAGRFCYMDNVKGNPRYLADIPRTLGYVCETLKRYQNLRTLKNLLLPYLNEVIQTCA